MSSTTQTFSLNQIDLNLLRTFDALMQERSVTRAAEFLGRTQSATSHALSRLRHIFKDELFSRDSGVMEPTPRAIELAAVLTRALADIRQVVDSHLNFEPASTFRNFRIGLSDSTSVSILPSLIQNFSAQAPNATLNVLHTREAEVFELLKTKQIECAVLGNISLKSEHITTVQLSTHRMVCAGWNGNPLLDDLTQERYLSSPHLQISADGKADGAADIVLRGLGFKRRVVSTISHYLVAPWIIKGTPLITVFGDDFIFAISEETETKIMPPPFALPDVRLSMIYERNSETDAGHAWFRSLIIATTEVQRVLKEEAYKRRGIHNGLF
ncbi:LysR family transcriptional regulator [Brucella tritici]|uniref:LysR family transcriptional regulator n=2 Tax=Brucella tritici TaxID=94626 RepID=A0A6L3YN28_9HYPH|nr:LysR family transcriptional regulator [Brucella tritici]